MGAQLAYATYDEIDLGYGHGALRPFQSPLHRAVNIEAASELFKLLGNFQPGWVFAILIGLVIAHRLPLIIRELFAGARGLQMALRRQNRVTRKTRR
jgi:hypothetical protein